MKNTAEKSTTIKLDTDKLFGHHWIEVTQDDGATPAMSATKIGQTKLTEKSAANYGKSQPKVALTASKFSLGKPPITE